MVRPSWLIQAMLAPQTSFTRNRGKGFFLQGESIILEFLGTSQIAVVKSRHINRNFISGDVVWVKKVAEDGVTLLEVQYFREGLLGAFRGTLLVQTTEAAKAEALHEVGTKLPKNLVDYLSGKDHEMPWALAPHLALLDVLSETKDTKFARKQMQRLLSVRDESGSLKGRRRNRHSRVLGIESTAGRIIKMSKARQQTAGAAAVAAAHLGEVVQAYETFFVDVHAFIDSKLKANTWDKGKRRHCTWLSSFSDQLVTWSGEFRKIDMHPFVGDCKKIEGLLIAASEGIDAVVARNKKDEEFTKASDALNEVLRRLNRMLSRLEMARVLRMVSLAADDRMAKLDIKITMPNWEEAVHIARKATHRWGEGEEQADRLARAIAAHDPERAYTAIKEMIKTYDNASRNAA